MQYRSTLLESVAAPESSAQPLVHQDALARQAIGDYIALTKPRIISLLLVVTLVPMFLAGEQAPGAGLILWTLLGGFLAAGGANALNQFIDRDIDHVMVRTRKRPLPAGRMTPPQVFWFGLGISALSFVQLWLTVNLLSALLALAGIGYYVVIYSWMLKRSSTQNIVVGGAAGAIPPLVGWAAVANEVSLFSILMFVIIFYWTPPHFWALALMRQKEYRAAGVPMLPVVAGERETYIQIVLYTILMILATLAPIFLGYLGPVYLAQALILNAIFLYQAVDIWRKPTNANVWRLYRYSLIYLALIFIAMGVDHLFFKIVL